MPGEELGRGGAGRALQSPAAQGGPPAAAATSPAAPELGPPGLGGEFSWDDKEPREGPLYGRGVTSGPAVCVLRGEKALDPASGPAAVVQTLLTETTTDPANRPEPPKDVVSLREKKQNQQKAEQTRGSRRHSPGAEGPGGSATTGRRTSGGEGGDGRWTACARVRPARADGPPRSGRAELRTAAAGAVSGQWHVRVSARPPQSGNCSVTC